MGRSGARGPERGGGLYRLLERPLAYRVVQFVLAPGAGTAVPEAVRRWLTRNPAEGPALDVGCGPSSFLRDTGLRPVGLDSSWSCARAFHRSGGASVAASATDLPFADGCFGSVWSFGLLHHLPDPDAGRALSEMVRVTRPGGFSIVFDAVLPRRRWRRPLAWLLRRLDRGAHMRRQEDVQSLLSRHGSWRCERFTYALTGLEAMLCSRRA